MSRRREFLRASATTGVGAVLGGLALPRVSAVETKLASNSVRFDDSIEPLVRLLEDTPRNKTIEEVVSRIKKGASYREVLAALLLAGVRNVQPRPSVGVKFHAVLVVNSAHLASLSSPEQDRWLPIMWAIDNFKSSQARDVREGDWTMAAVDESKVPSTEKARAEFIDAMDKWDAERADHAVAGLSRTAGANEIFELFAHYGIRDFRSIGHKAIFVANAYRTLQCIGWQHAEPVLRSLAYALQNHQGQPNPAESDLAADRPWRANQERVKKIREHWQTGRIDDGAAKALVKTLRVGSPDDACEHLVEIINSGVSPQSVYDALFLQAGELLMRQPGIVSLHAVTSTNAFNYAYRTVADAETRKMALLQNAAFLPLFRGEMQDRNKVNDRSIVEMEPGSESSDLEGIFGQVGPKSQAAAESALRYLSSGNSAEAFMDEARRYIFLKGNDSHDYKFSSAVLEGYYQISPQWRDRYLAASVFKMRGASGRDNGIVDRIRTALA